MQCDTSRTALCVNHQTSANAIPWTNAMVILDAPDGSVKKIPGVNATKRRTIKMKMIMFI